METRYYATGDGGLIRVMESPDELDISTYGKDGWKFNPGMMGYFWDGWGGIQRITEEQATALVGEQNGDTAPAELFESPEGRWVTINGRHVLIRQSPALAAQESRGLMQRLTKEGGFSYQPTLKASPTDGYMLSIFQDREQIVSEKKISIRDLRKYARKNRDLLRQDDFYLGAWKDQGKVYLDVSQRVANKKRALELARKHKQLAIYDLKSGESVYVNK